MTRVENFEEFKYKISTQCYCDGNVDVKLYNSRCSSYNKRYRVKLSILDKLLGVTFEEKFERIVKRVKNERDKRNKKLLKSYKLICDSDV